VKHLLPQARTTFGCKRHRAGNLRLLRRIIVLSYCLSIQLPVSYSRSELESTRYEERRRHRHPIFRAMQFKFNDANQVDTRVEAAKTVLSTAQEEALTLIRESYPSAYSNSTISHHFFVRMAPTALQTAISRFVWTTPFLRTVLSCCPDRKVCFGKNRVKVVRDVFDEIYLMRPEIDFVDEYKSHYDGILKLPGVLTLRSLTYLQGGYATFVAVTSGRNYTTGSGSAVVLDFNRELHYAIIHSNSETDNDIGHSHSETAICPSSCRQELAQPRVMIKAAVHIFDCQFGPVGAYFHIAAHRLIFFAIKSVRNAFEMSESTSLMILDNILRSLNKVHMILPIVAVTVPLSFVLAAPFRRPGQFVPYVVCVILAVRYDRTWRPRQTHLFLAGAAGVALSPTVLSIILKRSRVSLSFWTITTTFLLHIAWLGVVGYLNTNADMIRHILLAPIPDAIEIDLTNLDELTRR